MTGLRRQPTVQALVMRSWLRCAIVGLLLGVTACTGPGQSSPPTYQSQVANLEARPLRIPSQPETALGCQSGPYNSAGHFGSGPVYAYDSPGTTVSDWGHYYHITAYADGNLQGPIIIRALDLHTRQPLVFIGEYAAGPVVGTDTVDGTIHEQHLEVLIDTGTAKKHTTSHKFNWPFDTGVPKNWSATAGFQIDGVGFSETFQVC